MILPIEIKIKVNDRVGEVEDDEKRNLLRESWVKGEKDGGGEEGSDGGYCCGILERRWRSAIAVERKEIRYFKM